MRGLTTVLGGPCGDGATVVACADRVRDGLWESAHAPLATVVTSMGPGVRSTAASAVAASASRIAAPSRALESART